MCAIYACFFEPEKMRIICHFGHNLESELIDMRTYICVHSLLYVIISVVLLYMLDLFLSMLFTIVYQWNDF